MRRDEEGVCGGERQETREWRKEGEDKEETTE